MRKKTALRHFGGNAAALGRSIGVTRVTVRQWPHVIPLEPARALEIVTHGKVRVIEQLYPRLRLARRMAREAIPNEASVSRV
jgi:hypothetical protein